MKEGRCRQRLSSRQLRQLFLSALVLAWGLGGCGGAAAQQQPPTPTQTPTTQWVMLETERWTTLTNLAMTLETRLMQRVKQVETLQTLLAESKETIVSLQGSVVTLRTELEETRKSRDRYQRSLERERTLWSIEREALIAARNTARTQRDQEAAKVGSLTKSNRRNRTAWMVGIPVAASVGIVAGVVYESNR